MVAKTSVGSGLEKAAAVAWSAIKVALLVV
jgi:hypothetical protein